jgi:hypothetical protein
MEAHSSLIEIFVTLRDLTLKIYGMSIQQQKTLKIKLSKKYKCLNLVK